MSKANKPTKLDQQRLHLLLENAWLNVAPEEYLSIKDHIFSNRDRDSDPIRDTLRIMRDPANFYLTCKVIFNVELLPFQVVILQELWRRTFPILVGSRGLGKTFILAVYSLLRSLLYQGSKVVIVGSAFRQARFVFDYCQYIWQNSVVLRDIVDYRHDSSQGPKIHTDRCTLTLGTSKISALPIGDGCLTPYTAMTYGDHFGTMVDYHNGEETVEINNTVWSAYDSKFLHSDYGHFNGKAKTKKIFTETGFIIEGTWNHKLRVLDKSLELVWKRLDEITEDDYLPIDRSYRWHNGNFPCTEDEAYVLGSAIANSCWTQHGRFEFITSDIESVHKMNRMTGFNFHSRDNIHYYHYSVKDLQNWLDKWGLTICYAKNKYLPRSILSANRECMSACLRGLFDNDGTLQNDHAPCGVGIIISYTSASKILIYQMQYILLHYSIISTVSSRWRKTKDKWHICYELFINGKDVLKFYQEIGFNLKRKKYKLQTAIDKKKKWISKSDGVPYVKDYMLDIANKYSSKHIDVNTNRIKRHKIITRDYIDQFREAYSHINDDRIDSIVKVANRDIFYDKVKLIMDHKALTYDLHIPETNEYCAGGFFSHNSKIRGERATDILADEFGAQSREIFETVIAGFGVVSASPLQNVKQRAKIKKMEELGMPAKFIDEMTNKIRSNKIIISGTADYSWGHFCEYWRKWKTIIESKGDRKKLMEANIEPDINWQDYSIIRIPVDLIPPGFMDEKQLARSKSTIHSGTYQSEFGSVFSSDSTGFFKRSMIEACVVKSSMNKSEFPRGADIFTAVLQGKPHKQYVFGIDPASQVNNFSIVIQEIYGDHTRVIYGWSTNKAIFREKLNTGVAKEHDYYKYAARKIRDLMRDFPCIRIAMDSQGGGYAVMEALNDPNNMLPGELPIWEVIDPDKPKDTDDKAGLHILKLVMFSSAEYTMNANHGLRKDMEDKVLLFPQFDHISIAQATETDLQTERIYDTLEDCVMEIEELKNELATIIHTQTGITGRDRWDTPETKLATGKKGKLNKDRYSALLMANAEARYLMRNPNVERPQVTGGFAHSRPKYEKGGTLYVGPEWFTSGLCESIGFCKS